MKKGILFLVLCMSAMLWTNISKASELTDDYFDIATNFFNSNNLAKSIEYIDLILNIEPNNLPAKTLRNKIAPPQLDTTPKEAEEIAKVFEVIDTPTHVALVEVPQENLESVKYDSNYYISKGQEFYQKKDYDTAIEYFQKALALNKKNIQAYNNLAMCYWIKGNTSCAIKYFIKANKICKYYTQPLVNLSNLYKQLGRTNEQVYYLKKAVKLNNNDYLAYYWLGDYYHSIGKYPDAIINFKEAIKINPKCPNAYLSLAICFFETEDFNYCIQAINQYREFFPNSDYSYLLLSKAYLVLCNYEEAKVNIQKAIEINNCNDYVIELAKINYALEDYQAALDIFQDILKSGDSAEIFNYVGLCNYKLKNIEVAIANFNKAISLDGLRPIYYYNLAQCYKSIQDKKSYLKYINTATKINPINYQDFIDLSYIYYDNGNPGYAINSLNNAISKYPCVKSLYLSKLKIYEALGDNLHYNETKNLIEERFNGK